MKTLKKIVFWSIGILGLSQWYFRHNFVKSDDEILKGIEYSGKEFKPPMDVDTTLFEPKDTTPYKGKWVNIN